MVSEEMDATALDNYEQDIFDTDPISIVLRRKTSCSRALAPALLVREAPSPPANSAFWVVG
jgi:hypothetical protein